MFADSPLDVFLRRVLIIEEEEEVAAQLAAFVRDRGGEPIGPVSTAKDAAAAVDADIVPDLAIVAMDLDVALPIVRQLRQRGIPVVWVVGDDEWFNGECDDPIVFQREGDPHNVVRVAWPAMHSREI